MSTPQLYKPFLAALQPNDDWTEALVRTPGPCGLHSTKAMLDRSSRTSKVLVLYGSLRERSFSNLLSFEAARVLHHLGCDVRVYNARGLPLKDDCDPGHPKVTELRSLMQWSDANFWCSPEQHGQITGIFKTMIDHIPLNIGSVRPTQGKVLALSQVNSGSQSFNAVHSLRILGRWMRMFTIPNQSSLPMAWTQFDSFGRMMPSPNRDRLGDICEELVKVSVLFLGKEDTFSDRWSERVERFEHGRLRSQAEKNSIRGKKHDSMSK